MKKLTTIIAVLVVFSTASVFAFGIGAQAGYLAGSNGWDGAITFKLDSTPWVFAVNAGGGKGHLRIAGTADMWLGNPNLAGPFNWYYGWGLAAGVNIVDQGGLGLYLGARLPVLGINVFVLDGFLEFYLQGAWQPGVGIFFGNDVTFGFDWLSFPINLGFRFWF